MAFGRAPEPGCTAGLAESALVWIQAGTDGKQDGTGIVFSADGFVLTSYKVVEGHKEVTITVGAEKYLGGVVAQDSKLNVAIIKFAAKNLTTLTLGNADKLKLGDEVEVISFAAPPLTVAATLDRVRGKVMSNELRRLGLARLPLIEADLARAGVLLGSPLLNVKTGEVVGLVVPDSYVPNSPYLVAMGINAVLDLIQAAGIKIQSSAPPVDNVSQADVLEGNLLNPRLVTDWQFATGVNTGKLATRKHIQWWREMSGLALAAITPITIDRSRLYFGTRDERLYALIPSERRKQWDFRDLDYPMTYPPTIGNDIVCCATGSIAMSSTPGVQDFFGVFSITRTERKIFTHGFLHGLDLNTGQQKWRMATGFCSNPVIVGETVFFGGLGVYGALNIYDGNPRWVKDDQMPRGNRDRTLWFHLAYADAKQLYFLAVPIRMEGRSDGTEIRLYGDGVVKVLLVDAETGVIKREIRAFELNQRRGNHERPLGTAVEVDTDSQGQRTLYCMAGQELCAVNAQTGEAVTLKWNSKRKDGKAYAFVPQIAVHDGTVYVACEDRKVYAINSRTGEEIWSQPFSVNARPGPPVFHDGVVYFGTADGYLYAVSAREGSLLWRYEEGGEPVGPPRIVRQNDVDYLYSGSSNGKIYAVRVPQR